MATSKVKGQVIALKDMRKSKRGRTAVVDQDMVKAVSLLTLDNEDNAVLLDGFDPLPMDTDASAAVLKAQRAARAAHSIEIRKAWGQHFYGNPGKVEPGQYRCSINYTPEGLAQVSRGKLEAPAEVAADA